jgi:site-specific recombinase XerD
LELNTFHCFRHCFASRRLLSGLTMQEVATLLGHRDGGVLVLKTYGHVFGEHLRQAV